MRQTAHLLAYLNVRGPIGDGKTVCADWRSSAVADIAGAAAAGTTLVSSFASITRTPCYQCGDLGQVLAIHANSRGYRKSQASTSVGVIRFAICRRAAAGEAALVSKRTRRHCSMILGLHHAQITIPKGDEAKPRGVFTAACWVCARSGKAGVAGRARRLLAASRNGQQVHVGTVEDGVERAGDKGAPGLPRRLIWKPAARDWRRRALKRWKASPSPAMRGSSSGIRSATAWS